MADAGAGLEGVDPEGVDEAGLERPRLRRRGIGDEAEDLVGGLHDGLGQVVGEAAGLVVRARGRLLDVDAGADERDVRSAAADREVADRALRLDAVVGVLGHLQRAQWVPFEAVAGARRLSRQEASRRAGRGRAEGRIGHGASVAALGDRATARTVPDATIAPMAETALTTVSDADIRLPAIVAPPADAPTLAELFVFMAEAELRFETLRMRIVDRNMDRAGRGDRGQRGLATTPVERQGPDPDRQPVATCAESHLAVRWTVDPDV